MVNIQKTMKIEFQKRNLGKKRMLKNYLYSQGNQSMEFLCNKGSYKMGLLTNSGKDIEKKHKM